MIFRYAPVDHWIALLVQGWQPLLNYQGAWGPLPLHHGEWSVYLRRIE